MAPYHYGAGRGRGYKRGYGPGGYGYGRGYWGTGYGWGGGPWWMQMPPAPWADPYYEPTPEEEREMLLDYREFLNEELRWVEEKLRELDDLSRGGE
ncbi:MAG: hypothetical protein PWQ48_1629 [Thermotogaceae bacterium]|nr:hypothetical protein [Thermotogaceae bacterium]